jgi:hypothetical protein
MISASAAAMKPQIEQAVAEVLRQLSPSVERIKYDVAEDWSGETTVWFKILLSDEAAKRESLRQIAPRVRRILNDRIIPTLDIFPAFEFRSVSEQAEMKEPRWE